MISATIIIAIHMRENWKLLPTHPDLKQSYTEEKGKSKAFICLYELCHRNSVIMDLKLVCHSTFLAIFIWAPASSASETYDDLYVGCFNDSTSMRVLPDALLISDNMTIDVCLDYCTGWNDTDFAYAGVEFAAECFCGNAGTDYSRLGMLKDGDCDFRCAGDSTTICGGNGKISIYNVSLIRSPTTTETVSTSVIATSHDASTSSDKPTEEINDSTIPISTHSTKSSLYAGAGGGGAFLLILIIIIIVVVTCRCRNSEKRSASSDHPLTTMIPTKNDNQERNRPADKEEDPCYENKSAETERDYENMTVDNNELTYMNSEKRSTMKEGTHDPTALYAMPDLSAKNSSRPKTYTSPPNDTDDPSLLYAMPDRRAKTVYSSKGKPALEESLDALYTTSTKNRLEPIGMEASTGGEGLYALPDKNPRDHVTRNGAGKLDDNVEAMYAMPDKSRRGSDVDNTVMIENDIYSCT